MADYSSARMGAYGSHSTHAYDATAGPSSAYTSTSYSPTRARVASPTQLSDLPPSFALPPPTTNSGLNAKLGTPSRKSSLPPLPSPTKTAQFGDAAEEQPLMRNHANGAMYQNGTASHVPTPPINRSNSSSISPNPRPPASTSKRPNPLEDLIHTETFYVEDLGCIIKRVAAAWSRDNFPPPALDQIFRAIEAVYRINKLLLSKLNEIGPNPSSPKALGDLLMRWIDDLSPAYTRYSQTYATDYNHYDQVQSNPRLQPILDSLAWPRTLASPEESENSARSITLDELFLLPLVRLKYYKRLYAKLLKGTVEGRSDHSLLVGANIQLDVLLENCERAKSRSVVIETGGQLPAQNPSPESLNRLRNSPPRLPNIVTQSARSEPERSSGESRRANSFEDSQRSSSATGQTSFGKDSQIISSFSAPRIDELERKLDTSRAKDIFTMLPKKLCERMTSEERESLSLNEPSSTAEMWLLFPPLASKHLRVKEGSRHGELQITIMRKEVLVLRAEDGSNVLDWKIAIEDAIAFGASQAGPRSANSSNMISPISPFANSFHALQSPIHSNYPQPASPNYPTHASSYALHDQPHLNAEPSRNISPSEYERRAAASPGIPNDASFAAGPPPTRQMSSHDRNDRRLAAANAPTLERLPPRGQSIARGVPGNFPSSLSLASERSASSPGPLSPAYPNSIGTRGPSPNGTMDGYANSTGRQSPYAAPQQNYSDFQPEFPPNSRQNFPSRADPTQFNDSAAHAPRSDRVNSTWSSASLSTTRTDRSSAYPDPPRLPAKPFGQSSSDYGGTGPAGRRLPSGNSSSGYLTPGNGSIRHARSAEGLRDNAQHYRMPSAFLQDERSNSAPGSSYSSKPGSRQGNFYDENEEDDTSPPTSPVKDRSHEKATIVAQMRCKVFLQQQHAQWKSLGTAKLKVFLSLPSHTKQLVVESDKSGNKVLVSTIVLTDGVERVGKTGVAIELSDEGNRTGIIYMLQMKTEQASTGLFDQLLLGSDRRR